MKHIAVRLVAVYLLIALIGRLLERVGVCRYDCSADCWCQRPGRSVFRWAYPWGHR